jgi:hypothetical protein
VTPLLLAGAGVLAVLAGFTVVRTFGSAGRIGRIVAATRRVSIADATRLAHAGDAPYVRVDGRIDADEEFEDEAHRPLVLRLTRLEVRRHDRWETIDAARQAVPFAIRDGLDSIAIDGDVLDEGLVVVPRQATGHAAEIASQLPAETPPESPVRYMVRQVSSIEHAAVFGVPRVGTDGQTLLTAGHGRPLILTTVEIDEALRLLGGGRRVRSALAIGLLAIGSLAIVAGAVWAILELVLLSVGGAMAASPTPSPAAGDPRSPGEGPGFVGEPLVAIVGVLVIGAVTAAITYAWMKATTRSPGR